MFRILKTSTSRWRESLSSGCIRPLATTASSQVELAILILVPVISSLMWSAKAERVAAKATIPKLCLAIDNRDLEPFIPVLISSIVHPEEVEECVYQLSATRFVQTVNAATLSITVPLLQRGFNQGKLPLRESVLL